MADDLRERVRRGDLAALADPALELHLRADGQRAKWWRQGRQWCAIHALDAFRQMLGMVDIGHAGVDWEREDIVDWLIDEALSLRRECGIAPPGVDKALAVLKRYSR